MPEQIPTIFSINHRICSYDIDRHQKLSSRAMLNLFQEMANQHADSLGFGFNDLKNNNQAWVLSRMRIEITKRPKWNDHIVLKTWTAGMNGLFGTRHYEFIDSNGHILLSCASDWLIIDTEKRRPIRKSNDEFTSILYDKRPTEKPPIKLAPLKSALLVKSQSIDILDIDMMGHVNNIHYLAWVLNAKLDSNDDDYFPTTIDLNFQQEIKWPATITINKDEVKSNLFCIKDADSGNTYFTAFLDG